MVTNAQLRILPDTLHNLFKAAHGFFQFRYRVHTMDIQQVDMVQSHACWRLSSTEYADMQFRQPNQFCAGSCPPPDLGGNKNILRVDPKIIQSLAKKDLPTDLPNKHWLYQ